MRRSYRPLSLPTAASALLATACAAHSPAPGAPEARAPACVVVPTGEPPEGAPRGRSASDADISVALSTPVDPAKAPSGTGASERLVYGQLYRTLVEIDCEGRARPGLAASWSHDRDGLRWRFTLRDDARFWDGTPVTAHAVARSWASGPSPSGSPVVGPGIASASVEGDRELTVLLTEPFPSVEAFARPALAVTGARTDGGWPLGTGPYRPLSDPSDDPRGLRLVATDGKAAMSFRTTPGGDARAALDAGVDALVSTDPAVIAYARALPGFAAVPLPWSRTYVVAALPGWSAGGDSSAAPPAEALDGLARGAVRAEARPAEPPFWWTTGGCGGAASSEAGAPGRIAAPSAAPARRATPPRFVYPLGDAVARGLAERLVALAGRGPATPAWLAAAVPGLRDASAAVVAAGMDPAGLALAVRRGDALAFVVPVPRAAGGACLSELLAADDEMAGAVLAPGPGLRITALVDVRPSLVIRRGVAAVTVGGDGTLSFYPGGSEP